MLTHWSIFEYSTIDVNNVKNVIIEYSTIGVNNGKYGPFHYSTIDMNNGKYMVQAQLNESIHPPFRYATTIP